MYDFDKVTDRRNTGSVKWDVKEGELPMWVADMDFCCSPEIVKAVSDRTSHGIYGYTDINDDWRNAYVNWWKRRHSFVMEKERLLFCSGIVPAVASAIRALTEQGDGVLLMTPVYNIFFNLIRQNSRTVVENRLKYDAFSNSFSVDFEDLENKLSQFSTRLMILCNPQNPVGRIWQREELVRIGELAFKYGVPVISDEIHCDITAPGRLYVPFASLNETNLDNSVICISPTKAFNIAGIQSSCVYSHNKRLYELIGNSLNVDNINEPNVFAVPAAVAAFDRSETWLDEMREYVFENRNIAFKYMKDNIPLLKPVEGDATYLMWVNIEAYKIGSKRFTAFLREITGLFITAGEIYGEGCGNFVRINLACPETLLLDGLNRLKRGCDRIAADYC